MLRRLLMAGLVTLCTSCNIQTAVETKGVLEVQKLKTYEQASYTLIDVRVTNRSSHYITGYRIKADFFDSSGSYLANKETAGKNVGPNQSDTTQFFLKDVSPYQVGSWKLSVDTVYVQNSNDQYHDATRAFTV